MKYSILALTLVGMLFFACKEDDVNLCKTCDLTDPVLGLNISTEFCQEGDDVKATFTILSASTDTTYMNTTVAEQVTILETTGATCN